MSIKFSSKKYKEDEIMTAYINFITLSRETNETGKVNYVQKKSILKPILPKKLGDLTSQAPPVRVQAEPDPQAALATGRARKRERGQTGPFDEEQAQAHVQKALGRARRRNEQVQPAIRGDPEGERGVRKSAQGESRARAEKNLLQRVR